MTLSISASLSSSTCPTGAGIQVTFKTVTYHGDSGGAGADGADGISFFLQDGSDAFAEYGVVVDDEDADHGLFIL